MYWDFPGVSADDFIQRSPVLDPATIRLSPHEAYARLDSDEPAARVRLNTFDGRPVYRFGAGRGDRLVYADTGEEQVLVSPEMARRIASAWTLQPATSARQEFVEQPDQWTVQESFRALMPLWKFSWPDGEQVYISDATGEVVQYTTTRRRFWAYLGAIPHWLYFTPLRRHGAEWSRLVIWLSATGAVTASLGIAIGLWMYSPGKRYQNEGRATRIPYRGQKRWHAILGLLFGAGAVTWAFSGMMSMDPFPRARRKAQAFDVANSLRGPIEFGRYHPREALESGAPGAKQIELISIGGDVYYIATFNPHLTRVLPPGGAPFAEFAPDKLVAIVRKAAPPEALAEVRELREYDRYYLDRRGELPLPVILVRLNDADHSRYYIDPKTARVAGVYSSRAWMERWLYHALHSLDFPWFYRYRPLWDVVVILFMLGGGALSVTSLILAWRVVLRKMAWFEMQKPGE